MYRFLYSYPNGRPIGANLRSINLFFYAFLFRLVCAATFEYCFLLSFIYMQTWEIETLWNAELVSIY